MVSGGKSKSPAFVEGGKELEFNPVKLFEEARKSYETELEDRKQNIIQHGESRENLTALSLALERLGDIDLALGLVDNATSAFEEQLIARRKIIADYGENSEALRALAVALEKVGDARKASMDMEGAIKLYDESVTLRMKAQSAEENSPGALYAIASLLEKKGALENSCGRPDKTRDAFEESANILERYMSAEYSDVIVKSLVNTLGEWGMFELFQGNYKNAKSLFERALEKAMGYGADSLWLEINLAHAALFMGNVDGARHIYSRHAKNSPEMVKSILGDFSMFREKGLPENVISEAERGVQAFLKG